MVNVKDLTITSLETITAFGISDDAYLFTLDELQNSKIANTQDKQDITGKQGRKLNSIKKNKAVVVSGTNGYVSGGLLETQTGSSFESKDDASVIWTDYLEVKSNKATTTYKAVGEIGSEIKAVYIRNKEGAATTKFTQGAEVNAGVFTYSPASKELAFNTSEIEDGTEIVVIYNRAVKASVLKNKSDVYSKKCKLFVDAFAEDSCNTIYHVQFFIPKADFSGNFDVDMGENQTVHAFEAESLAGSCGSSGELWTYTVFENDAADYTAG